MSNALYDNARMLFLTAGLNWTQGVMTYSCILVDTTKYNVNTATDQYLNVIAPAAIVAGPVTLTSLTSTAGAANAANVTFNSVTGATCEAIVIYMNTGVSSTSPLVCYIDTATGLPITPNGGNIIITWDTGVNKIFKL